MRQAVGRNSCRIVRRRDDLGKNHNDNSINDLKIYLTQYTLSEMTFLEVALIINMFQCRGFLNRLLTLVS